MRKFSWIIWVGPPCSQKCPYNSEVEGDLTTERKAMRGLKPDAAQLALKMEGGARIFIKDDM